MRKLIVDRYEGQYVICEDEDQKLFAIETGELPEKPAPGTVLVISDEGVITADLEETEQRRKRILEKQRRLMQ